VGDLRQSSGYFEEALKVAPAMGDRSHALTGLGVVLALLGEPWRAIQYVGQALAIARELGDRRGEVPHLAISPHSTSR
jgi:tetratricopeptide (TPR) repeat protein